ncbi:DUF2911 domain-containing protein [Robiginitalea marina]|uniref:DUF2911 domain-containing protein n=1 Tax=Robiginitalea marina TaxID=2954105 RepID=A0ABT1B0U0_9FLAO|nr:DUF2911 domain-containing protein [Robiginitalea marina]MCO5725914.1 DUF2911 domain-containing protein [Robiginitalea marina]
MKPIFTLTTLFFSTILCTSLLAQEFSGLDKSPMDMASYPSSYRVSEKVVRITYSRPQLKGRSLADLAPAGQVWRTGANEAPEITFYQDVTFGGQEVKAGTYSLFTIPGADQWTVILNNNLNQWGAYTYEEAADVLRVSVPAASGEESLDAFSIAFQEVGNAVHLVMGWGNTRVAVPIVM